MSEMKTGPHPEPVPAASQLAVLPFAAAVEGYLTGEQPNIRLRLTVHRIMNREGQQYLQQLCRYLGPESSSGKLDTGRLLPVNYGIVGQALKDLTVLRTRHYPTQEALLTDLRKDFETIGRDVGKLQDEPLSWLAVPFQASDGKPVLVLFADCHQFNFFADDLRVEAVVNMCWGFARLADRLEQEPLPNLRNFGFDPGENVTGPKTVYETVQEWAKQFSVPKFQVLKSFNYESSAA